MNKLIFLTIILCSSECFAKTYAVVENGKVTNIIEWDGTSAWAPSKDLSKTLVDVSAKNALVDAKGHSSADAVYIGDIHMGGSDFEKPEEP